TSKVFSPQYLLWFGPLIAVMITLDGGRLTRAIGVLMVVTAGLTSWFFPLLFDSFIEAPPSLLSVVVLTLRNLLMLVVTVLACRWAWVCLVAEHRAESAGDSPRS
ncbi:MAG: hypothetical protein GX983_10765, partial [Corynebacterium sp.]|nr:hypothetical protein [Corynebacterium sp.]